jgi:hypothetical protein
MQTSALGRQTDKHQQSQVNPKNKNSFLFNYNDSFDSLELFSVFNAFLTPISNPLPAQLCPLPVRPVSALGRIY